MRLLLPLVLALLAPAASADGGCLAALCLEDEAVGSATCASYGQFGAARTTAAVRGPAEAYATGYDQCVHADSGRYRQQGVVVGAAAAGQGATLAWHESTQSGPQGESRHCAVSVSAATAALHQARVLGCPADKAPPNPGWGRLLP